MWPRIVEVMLACWLTVSPFIFDYDEADRLLWITAYLSAAAVATLSLLSLSRRFDKMHLGILVVAAWLAVTGYAFGGERPAPAAYQNDLVVGLLLAMLAILPTRTSEPPQRWLELYARLDSSARDDGADAE